MGLDQSGLELECPLKERNRLTRSAERSECVGRIDECFDVVRLECQRPLQARQRSVPLAMIVQGSSQIAVRFAIHRHQFRRSAQRLQRVPALPYQRHAQDLPEHPIVGIRPQQCSSPMFRLAQAVLIDQCDQCADLMRIQNARSIHRARSSASPRATLSGSSQGSKCFH